MAYGSNLLRSRFLTYLRGGPVPGSGRIQHGARDATDPIGDQPLAIELPLAFGRSVAGWGGAGVAFVDPARRRPDATLGRAWLITAQQLTDVWAQENGGTEGPTLDVAALVRDGSAELARGWYRRLLTLGALDGAPVVTLTCPELPALNAAGHGYLEVMGRGLMASWGLVATEAAAYLADRDGNRGVIDAGELVELLTAPADPITGVSTRSDGP
ncbi:MAG: histone deacetylase [Actinomycetota bacterium]